MLYFEIARHEVVDAATFRLTMAECMKKLQTLAENPAPISDTEKSLQRLKEVCMSTV